MERLAGADAAARLADRQPGRRLPVLPLDVGQRRRHGAVRGQPGQERDEAAVAVELADVPPAVRGVGQAVQEDDGTHRRPVRLQDVGAVPVVGEAAGIDRAALEVAVDRHPLVGLELLGDLGPHLVEDGLLGGEVAGPVERADLLGGDVVGDVGVPDLERQAAPRLPGADPQKGDEADQRPAPPRA